jgi:hypothetical protein
MAAKIRAHSSLLVPSARSMAPRSRAWNRSQARRNATSSITDGLMLGQDSLVVARPIRYNFLDLEPYLNRLRVAGRAQRDCRLHNLKG